VADGRTLRLAHRGDWRAAPENSLDAMRAALAIPRCDGLELDVRSAADGVAVVIHDATLARVQGVPAACATMTAVELATHGIPTLADVLQVAGDAFLDVELKERVSSAIEDLDSARGVVEGDGGRRLREAAISTFDAGILEWLREVRPAWPRWLNAIDLAPRTIAEARDLGCAAIAVQHHAIDADSAERTRDAGLEVAAWTVRSTEDYARLEALGVVAICAEGAALDG
jgi:glycerophosphoryl diester phosphodiesterase